jgi:anti-anti-sigma factor
MFPGAGEGDAAPGPETTPELLTERERQVLNLVAMGMGSTSIASPPGPRGRPAGALTAGCASPILVMDFAGLGEDNAAMSGRQSMGTSDEAFLWPDFDVVSISRDDEVIVALRGEVDLATAPLLERELALGRVRDARAVLVDLERVAFMDLTGLQPLLSFASPERPGHHVSITMGPPAVQRLLDLSGLRRYFNVVDPTGL